MSGEGKHEFAAALRELHRKAGSPPFKELERLAKDRGQWLPSSTASDAIRGRRLPAVTVVIRFVESCHAAALAAGMVVDVDDFNIFRWQTRWRVAQDRCLDGATSARQEPPPAERPVPPPVAAVQQRWVPGRGSDYLLIGVGSVRGLEGSDLPEVAMQNQALRETLERTAPWLQVTQLEDPTRRDIEKALDVAAARTREVLFVHLNGHGFLDGAEQLHFLARDAHPGAISPAALALTGFLSRLQTRSQAQAVVLIVDSCFAGRAIAQVPASAHTFVLAASGPFEAAYSGERSLTGCMSRILASGDPSTAMQLLSMDSLAAAVTREMKQYHRPQTPMWASTGQAGEICISLNTAAGAATGPTNSAH